MQEVTMHVSSEPYRFAVGSLVAAATLISCCIAPTRAGAQTPAPSTPGSGRIWYEKYCTPCHGPGGAPGSAVFVATEQPIDLRTYVRQRGGTFPAGEWLMVVMAEPPQNPHTEIWQRMRQDEGGAHSEIGARAKVRSIADYILSIQAK
jgi:hypothetical protein